MKNITEFNITFPIIIIGPERTIEICKSARALTITTKLGLNKQIQINNELIDSNGNFFKTVRVEKVKQLSPEWKFWKTNPLVETRLFAIQETSRSLIKFKRQVIILLRRNSDFWETTINLETLIERVDASQTFNDVIQNLYVN